MDWHFDNNNPPNDATVFSLQYDKTGKLVRIPLPSSIYSLCSPTTHINVNNIENKTNITPPPPSSHKTNTTCTNQVMTNKYVLIGPYESVSFSFGYPPPPTLSTNSSDSTTATLTTSALPTMSRRKVLERHRKKCKQKARDKHTKNIEQQVNILQQQLKEEK